MTNFNNVTNDTRNFITKDKYLITEELQYSLDSGELYQENDTNANKTISDFNFVIIRVLNKDKQVLVYSYIPYRSIFLHSFIYFMSIRSKVNGNLYREPGDFLCVVDSSLYGGNLGGPLALSKTAYDINRLTSIISDSYYSTTSVEIIKLINKLMLQNDLSTMANIVDLAIKKDYKNFIKEVLSSVDNYDRLVRDVDYDNIKPISIINGCCFIVGELDKFVQNIKDKGYNINQGPQPNRGKINSINFCLSTLDMEYRKSLYNHNNYHVSNANVDGRFKLNKEKFSFNNIHMNIGGVKWYSTVSNRNLPKDRDELLQVCSLEIDGIIKQNNVRSLEDLQREIEDTLFERQTWFGANNKVKPQMSYKHTTYDFITENKSKIKDLLSNPDKYVGNTKTLGTEYTPWYKSIINELGADKLSNMLIEYYLYIVTNESIRIEDTETPGIPSLLAYDNFGKRAISRYLYGKYTLWFRDNKNKTFSDFKDVDSDCVIIDSDDNINARVGGFFIYTLIECGLIKLALDKKVGGSFDWYKHVEYIRLTDISRETLIVKESQSIFHMPSKLPMICPPKGYQLDKKTNKLKLGGYLLNDIKYSDKIFIDKIGYTKSTVLKNKNIIVDLINGLSRTPYKINTDTLDYIYKYGVEKCVVMDSDDNNIKNVLNNPYKSVNKKTTNENRSIISKLNLERNILNIAELYSQVNEIYFPVRMDHRTRIYCITDYFDYQKNDLAKGLISFANPGSILKTDTDVIKYFKAFGANMYGDNLDKKSLNYRVDWINNNSETILDFENNNIVNKAENKCCFISFCFEYKRFIEFMLDDDSKVFYSYLPIQLDASCNGYQHLSLLTREKNLFEVLNLASSTHDDDPDDFYKYISDLNNKHIKHQASTLKRVKDKSEKQKSVVSSYDKLSKVIFNRSIVKKIIMLLSYNAGIPTLVEKIASIMQEIYIDKKKYYAYEGINFRREDIVVYVMALKSVIAKESPRITELSKYIDGIVSICTRLNIPVPWILPTGAEILESYEVERSKTIKAFFFVNTRYTFKSYQRGVYDLSKQKRATMPNIIHSLDATTIGLLYKNFKSIGPLYTVHDCFGVTANNVPKLIIKLKLAYTQLYSSSIYLRDFDLFVKTTINKTRGQGVYKMGDNFVNVPVNKEIYRTESNSINILDYKTKKIPMPDVNKVLDKSIDVNCLNKSSNLII